MTGGWSFRVIRSSGPVALDDPEVVRVLARLHVWPITREMALAGTQLDVQGDPADEIIAATSVIHDVSVADARSLVAEVQPGSAGFLSLTPSMLERHA